MLSKLSEVKTVSRGKARAGQHIWAGGAGWHGHGSGPWSGEGGAEIEAGVQQASQSFKEKVAELGSKEAKERRGRKN